MFFAANTFNRRGRQVISRFKRFFPSQLNMEGPPKTFNVSSSSSCRAKGEKWTQDEMQTLVSLCISHGRSGILSKETNKATCAKKDAQWVTIESMFNSIHPPRDKKALNARYKFIVMHLRKDNAAKRVNIMATGGGPSTSSQPPFQITGEMLELANILGVSITGLPGFGSDSQKLETIVEPVSGEHEECYEYLIDEEHPAQDELETIVTDIDAEILRAASAAPQIEVQNTDLPSTPFPGRSSFFGTQSQRRTNKRKVALAAADKNEERKAAKHAAEMHFEEKLLEAKLKEMRENEIDRQLKRERDAELHAMQKEIMAAQKEVLLAQRDAFARASGNHVLELAMQHASIPTSGSLLTSESISKELKPL